MKFFNVGCISGGLFSSKLRFTQCLLVLAATCLAACENYTLQPLCHSGNRLTTLPGLDGTYSLSWQDQDFKMTQEIFEIRQAKDGLVVSTRTQGSAEPEMRAELCSWPNGWIVAQSQEESAGLYSYQRVTVGPMGYFAQPIAFDRAQLEALKVPYSVTPIRRQNLVTKLSSSFLRATISGDGDEPESSLSLVVDNRDAPFETMVSAAHALLGAVAAVRR